MSHLCSRFRLFIAVLIATSLGSAIGAEAFQRNISFCNRTTTNVNVAVAYEPTGTSDTRSLGWFVVRGCTCRSILSADFRATEYYLLATRSGLTNLLQNARAPLCALPRRFDFMRENANRGACNRANGQWVTWKQFIAEQTSHRVNLRTQGQCNLMGDT
jgi:uncharacterized membrane protein